MDEKLEKKLIGNYTISKFLFYIFVAYLTLYLLSLVSNDVERNFLKMALGIGFFLFFTFILRTVKYYSLKKVIRILQNAKLANKKIVVVERSKNLYFLVEKGSKDEGVVNQKELQLIQSSTEFCSIIELQDNKIEGVC